MQQQKIITTSKENDSQQRKLRHNRNPSLLQWCLYSIFQRHEDQLPSDSEHAAVLHSIPALSKHMTNWYYN